MARLTCPDCLRWLADVSDETWRVVARGECEIQMEPSSSSDLWSDFDLVEKRAEEWRPRGVFEPMPPPPDPPLESLTLTCGCGRRTRFDRPVRDGP